MTMMVLAGFAALAVAAALGYYLGRRRAVAPTSWKRRTSRVALGGLVFDLLVALTARRVRHSPMAVVAASLVARVRTY